MRRAALCAFALLSCGHREDPSSPELWFGSPPGEDPMAQSSVLISGARWGGKGWNCSGTWLGGDLVLTAGHCLRFHGLGPWGLGMFERPSSVRVIFPEEWSTTVCTIDSAVPPRWKWYVDEVDLMLLRLSPSCRPPKTAIPGRLAPQNGALPGPVALFAWGASEDENRVRGVMKITGKMTLPKSPAIFPQAQLPVVFTPPQGVCPGDSGGGVFSAAGELAGVLVALSLEHVIAGSLHPCGSLGFAVHSQVVWDAYGDLLTSEDP